MKITIILLVVLDWVILYHQLTVSVMIGGTQTGSYQTGSYPKGPLYPSKTKIIICCVFYTTTAVYYHGSLNMFNDYMLCVVLLYHLVVLIRPRLYAM